MRISTFMRPVKGETRREHSLPMGLDTSAWPEEIPIFPDVIYDVLDEAGDRVGEAAGEQLDYLVRAGRKLPLHTFIDVFSEGLVVVDADGRICLANSAYSRIIGVPLRVILGKNMYVIEPDAQLLSVLREGKPMERERSLVKSVGKMVSMRMYPLLQDGRTVGAYSIFKDVTELHKLGQEVRRITGVAQEYISQVNLKNELEYLQIKTRSPRYRNLISQAITAAGTDAAILVNGENGSGKEMFTKLIHANSPRKNKPFIAVNCAAIPESLIESELFGYENGAFTGAKKGGKIGKFQLAEGGTLFLDEVGDMPLLMQTKLLRALQEGEIERVGGEKTISVDVRIISATNQPLAEMIRDKRFREDLYYRLNVISFTIPPLRERREDIMLLTNQFLQRLNKKYGKNVSLSESVFELLIAYDWPGNVRELQNCVEACVVMSSSDLVTPDTLPGSLFRQIKAECRDFPGGRNNPDPSQTAAPRHFGTLKEETERFERQVISAVLEQYGGDQQAALRHLGISRRTLFRKK